MMVDRRVRETIALADLLFSFCYAFLCVSISYVLYCFRSYCLRCTNLTQSLHSAAARKVKLSNLLHLERRADKESRASAGPATQPTRIQFSFFSLRIYNSVCAVWLFRRANVYCLGHFVYRKYENL